MKSVVFEYKNGNYTLATKNGKLKTNEPEISYIQHNLLCFGRASKTLISEPRNRNGWSGEFNDNESKFSLAWIYYLEGSIDESSVGGIVREFNKACERDLKRGLFSNKILLQSVIKLDNSSLLFKINIGGINQDIVISI